MQESLQIGGCFIWEHCAQGGEVLAWGRFDNNIVDIALNHILETQFRGGTPITTWYIGLIDQASYVTATGIQATDTMATHAGWTENTSYSESTRPQWSPAAAAGGSIINPTRATFTMNAQTTLKGLFITSNNTKGGTTGTLWAHGLFDGDRTMQSGELLKVYYRLDAVAG